MSLVYPNEISNFTFSLKKSQVSEKTILKKIDPKKIFPGSWSKIQKNNQNKTKNVEDQSNNIIMKKEEKLNKNKTEKTSKDKTNISNTTYWRCSAGGQKHICPAFYNVKKFFPLYYIESFIFFST